MRFRKSECCIYFRCCGKCLLNVIRMTNESVLLELFTRRSRFFGGGIKQMIIIIVIVLVFVLCNYVIWWIATVWCSVCHNSIPSQSNQTKQCQSNVQLNVSFKNALQKNLCCVQCTHTTQMSILILVLLTNTTLHHQIMAVVYSMNVNVLAARLLCLSSIRFGLG